MVTASISLVIAAINSQTKVFTDPPTAIQQELEDVTAAKNIPNSEKKKLLRSLTLALRAARHIQFPTNIELVRKYYDNIYVTTIAVYDGDSYSSVGAQSTNDSVLAAHAIELVDRRTVRQAAANPLDAHGSVLLRATSGLNAADIIVRQRRRN